MTNWGRSASSDPVRTETPRSTAEVAALVGRALDSGLRVKPFGALHSFTSVALTDGVAVDCSGLSGVIGVDGTKVRLGAGTRLYDLPALLAPYGLALQNMGDIDRQTLAGATSTGTHGTGLGFGGIASRITAVRFVDGQGQVRESDAATLPALQVGLGALGLVTEIEVDCVPAFLLRAHERAERFDPVLDGFVESVRAEDHYEAYWWPHTDTMSVKTNTRAPIDEPYAPRGKVQQWVGEELVGNGGAVLIAQAGLRLPRVTPRLNELAARSFAAATYVDTSPRIFATRRRVRFKEMEYAVPLAALPTAVRELRSLVERRGWRVSFPVELRAAAADTAWLSTSSGRETGYIAIHRYWREDPTEYFTEAEAIFRAHDGRPHWGKLHTLRAAELATMYPDFERFLALREELDPERTFANDYTRRVLGE